MRRQLIAAALAALAAGCSLPEVVVVPQAPQASGAAPLDAHIASSARGVRVLVSRPAHVAVFEIVPDSHTELLYPSPGEGRADGYVVAGGRVLADDEDRVRPSGRSDRTAAGRREDAPRYLFLIASERPLRLEPFGPTGSGVEDAMGRESYSAHQPSDAMERLVALTMPEPRDDASWTTDFFLDWPQPSGDRLASRAVTVRCDGHELEVPADLAERVRRQICPRPETDRAPVEARDGDSAGSSPAQHSTTPAPPTDRGGLSASSHEPHLPRSRGREAPPARPARPGTSESTGSRSASPAASRPRPSTPARPVKPVRPVKPGRTAGPDEPEKPAKPARVKEHEKPAKEHGKPEKPAEPAKPSKPAEHGKPARAPGAAEPHQGGKPKKPAAPGKTKEAPATSTGPEGHGVSRGPAAPPKGDDHGERGASPAPAKHGDATEHGKPGTPKTENEAKPADAGKNPKEAADASEVGSRPETAPEAGADSIGGSGPKKSGRGAPGSEGRRSGKSGATKGSTPAPSEPASAPDSASTGPGVRPTPPTPPNETEKPQHGGARKKG
jgi:hypothetical protein